MTDEQALFRNSEDQSQDDPKEFDALTSIIQALRVLSEDGKIRVMNAVLAFLGLSASRLQPNTAAKSSSTSPRTEDGAVSGGFSEDRSLSPKSFLFEKKPQTDVERVAALAYYLTHYRETPHFKTLDISKLNTEAAQLKLSNPAKAVDNATRTGLLVPASKGAKQLSALGELYVQALPDRAAARAATVSARPKRRDRRTSKPVSQITDDQEIE